MFLRMTTAFCDARDVQSYLQRWSDRGEFALGGPSLVDLLDIGLRAGIRTAGDVHDLLQLILELEVGT